MKRKIILASASKRRSQILSSCAIRHKVVPSRADETHSRKHSASWIVVHNARKKAEAVAKKRKDSLVIGADTLVRMDSHIIGKPETAKEAKGLLRRFSGNRIEVITGLCLIDTLSGKRVWGCEKSSLYVRKMKKSEIEKFFKLLGPYDKAGGFSMEGAGSMLFDDIRGSYFNILGLPMIKLKELFNKLKLDIVDFIGR